MTFLTFVTKQTHIFISPYLLNVFCWNYEPVNLKETKSTIYRISLNTYKIISFHIDIQQSCQRQQQEQQANKQTYPAKHNDSRRHDKQQLKPTTSWGYFSIEMFSFLFCSCLGFNLHRLMAVIGAVVVVISYCCLLK